MIRTIAILAAALALTGCSAASKQWFQSRANDLAAVAAKVKEVAPKYCKLRPLIDLDDRALAAVALATSEQAADVVKAGVDKLCSWVGEPVETKQAAD